MQLSKLAIQIKSVMRSLSAYLKECGIGFEELLWSGFMLVLGVGLFIKAWPGLTLLSGGMLLVLTGGITYLAWRWQAMQITVAMILLVTVLILFTGQVGSYIAPLAFVSLILLLALVSLWVWLESGSHRFTFQHINLVLWLVLGSCMVLVLLRWVERPAIGLHYAALPLASQLDVMLLITIVLLFFLLRTLRKVVITKPRLGLFLPGTILAAYVLLRLTFGEQAEEALPEVVLEHGLLLLHVPAMVLAFVMLLRASGCAVSRLASHLIWNRGVQNKDVMETIHSGLDDELYDLVKHGILLLGIGLFSGMLWSALAWGHYWVWETKQLMSFALWLYYLALLHFRLQKGKQGRMFAVLCLLGLPLLLATLIGTNVWPAGLHNFIDG